MALPEGDAMTVHFVMLPMAGGATHAAVNPDLVRCVLAKNHSQAEVHFDDQHRLVVEKTMEQVVRDLEIAGR
jgi:hypothetical protein